MISVVDAVVGTGPLHELRHVACRTLYPVSPWVELVP
jgi:hypothetical protein